MRKNWLNLTNLLKRIFTFTEIVYHLMNKKLFSRLVQEKSYEFQNLKEKINPKNLIYNYKAEGKSQKYFSGYQNQIDLGEIIKVNPKSNSKDPASVVQNVQIFF